ncbi:hypothetical protein [Flavobacterium nackdongense]|uniref:Uncharacterized protein n=1 Tax=Flavobacterium nackdongense TaxID=2547394 RepID=A0A4P6YB68_9FLAO|nr:hypothetical protein [Flavobacterium nackdongense]QBN17493.1 hypothetical protein E1750_01335 [Flavobacterium nackdongense]
MKNILFLFAILYSFNTSAQTWEKIKLAENEIPAEYKLTNESQCISIQACTFYKRPDMYESFIGKLKSKDIQNFENKKDSGSIMYFEFEEKFEMESFLKGLLWGGNKATREHPEQIYVKDKILIIYSFPLKSSLVEVSKKKLETELK